MTAEQTQPHPADKLAASEGGSQGALMSLWTQLSSLAGGLGLFLLGMTMMTDGLKLAAGPALERILAGATRTRWHALGSGMLVTALVQASGAVTVATIGFVNAGLLSLGPALWVVIGANIGTTVTALFAAIGATPNARRAAAAHVVFNVITGVVALALLPWLIGALGAARAALGLPSDPAAKLALFHTIFNLLGVLLMWPLAAPLTRWLQARIGHVAVPHDARGTGRGRAASAGGTGRGRAASAGARPGGRHATQCRRRSLRRAHEPQRDAAARQ